MLSLAAGKLSALIAMSPVIYFYEKKLIEKHY